jgi:P-type Ca2+ transporter type 2C
VKKILFFFCFFFVEGKIIENKMGGRGSKLAVDEEVDCPWRYNLHHLNDFMSTRPEEARLEKLAQMGGIEGLADGLGTNLVSGLSAAEATDLTTRKKVYTENWFPENPRKSVFALWLDAMKDVTLIILLIAALVSLIIGIALPEEGEETTSWIEGAAILIAVLIVSIMTATLDYHQESRFRDSNRAEQDKLVQATRGGEQSMIPVAEIVVGDVIVLATGDQISADGILIQGDDLTVDESVMTGESVSAKKVPNTVKCFMLGGCNVDNGVGRMLVTAVGEHTAWGKMLKMLVVKREETPLQKKLGVMAMNIGWAGLAVAVAVFIVLVIYWAVEVSDKTWDWEFMRDLLDFFIISITIVVVAIPVCF